MKFLTREVANLDDRLATSLAAVLGNQNSRGPAVDVARDKVLGMNWGNKILGFRSFSRPWAAAQYRFASSKVSEATVLSPLSWGWLVQRSWGPVSVGWIRRIVDHGGYRGVSAPGGVEVFSAVVSYWESNLRKTAVEGPVYVSVGLAPEGKFPEEGLGAPLLRLVIPAGHHAGVSTFWVITVATASWSNLIAQSSTFLESSEQVFVPTLVEAETLISEADLELGKTFLTLAVSEFPQQAVVNNNSNAEELLSAFLLWFNPKIGL